MNRDNAVDLERKRGLGPFTGGQLTIIVVSVIIALGLPVGAFAAVSGSNVFITDHSSNVHAGVSSTGSLKTTNLTAPGSRELAPVAAQDANACAFLQLPPEKAFVVTEVVWAPKGANVGADVSEHILLDANKTCSEVLNRVAGGNFAQDGVYETTFSPGYVVQQGHYLDLDVSGGGGDYSEAFVYGYYIPSSECAGISCN